MGCGCLSSIITSSLGQAARFGHLLLFMSVLLLATVMGGDYQEKLVGDSTIEIVTYVEIPGSLNLTNLLSGCDENSVEECVYNQVVYRACFALTGFFGFMAVMTKYSDSLNKGLWGLKFLALFGCFIGFWWGDNDFFSAYAEVSRIIAFFWLLIQGLLVLDVAHDIHDILLLKASNESAGKGWSVFYLLTAVGFLVCSVIGADELYVSEGGYTGCSNGSFFVTFGIIISCTQLLLSALNTVNGGVLTPSMMFAYGTFMTWYALLSNPDEECNPTASLVAGSSGAKKVAQGLVIWLSISLLLFCVVNGSKILQIFSVSGQGVLESGYGGYGTSGNGLDRGDSSDGMIDITAGHAEEGKAKPAQIGYTGDDERENRNNNNNNDDSSDSTGTGKERSFFHALLCLASCYACMVLTSWGKTDGAPEAAGDSYSSMWIKIISLWVFYLMYYKALHLAYLKQTGQA